MELIRFYFLFGSACFPLCSKMIRFKSGQLKLFVLTGNLVDRKKKIENYLLAVNLKIFGPLKVLERKTPPCSVNSSKNIKMRLFPNISSKK